jgi:NADPH:quinone reductase
LVRESSEAAVPEVKVNYLSLKNINVSGPQVSDYSKSARAVAKFFAEIVSLHERGQFKPAPTITYPLEK